MSVENPICWFQHMPAVTSLLRRDHSWKLCETHSLETHYCRAADDELDKFMTWSKKPTHLLVKNIPLGYRLPQCEHKCRYRFPQGSGKEKYHLKAVRIDAKSIEGQTRLLDWHRDAIPQGLFRTLWHAHLEHKAQLDVQSHYSGGIQAPYGSGGGIKHLSGGADPTCAHRERHPRFRTLTQRLVLTDAQTDWAGKWARRGTCMALESTLVPFVWPRTAAGCDQGPPSVEPRWRRCSVQIQIRTDSTSGCRSEPCLPAMCTPISVLAPISCDVGDP